MDARCLLGKVVKLRTSDGEGSRLESCRRVRPTLAHPELRPEMFRSYTLAPTWSKPDMLGLSLLNPKAHHCPLPKVELKDVDY